MEHQATEKPTSLVLPVLTRPDIVQQAVVGILCGQIGLTLSNVEDLLVLANAVGVSLIIMQGLAGLHLYTVSITSDLCALTAVCLLSQSCLLFVSNTI